MEDILSITWESEGENGWYGFMKDGKFLSLSSLLHWLYEYLQISYWPGCGFCAFMGQLATSMYVGMGTISEFGALLTAAEYQYPDRYSPEFRLKGFCLLRTVYRPIVKRVGD